MPIWLAMPATRVRLLVMNAALGPLDYRVPEGMDIEHGSVVVAPLGPRQVTGIVWEDERLLRRPRPLGRRGGGEVLWFRLATAEEPGPHAQMRWALITCRCVCPGMAVLLLLRLLATPLSFCAARRPIRAV